MRPLATASLRWKEPRQFQRAGYREAKRSLTRVMALASLAFLVLIGFTCVVAVEATGPVCVAFGLVTFLLYAFLWVYRVFPSHVQLSAKGISQSVATDDETTWELEAIGHCEIATTQVDGDRLRVLVIQTKQGDRSEIGIADSVSTEEIQEFLVSQGVPVITGAKPGGAGHGLPTPRP